MSIKFTSEINEFENYLQDQGIQNLYPLQEKSIKIISHGESLLLATPTSSGKSLVAYFGMLRTWKMGGRSLYVVPLRALAEEKYEDLKYFEKFGLRVTISTGDYDRPSGYLKDYDVVIATSEKVDSLLRNNPAVFENMGFVAFDEIHNILDESRGTTLEIVISKIRQVLDGVQFIAMSATVRNAEQISEWLGCKLVVSDFRPVPLMRFVVTPDIVYDESGQEIAEVNTFEDFIIDTLTNSGQTIIFVRSRKSAESLAEKLSYHVSGILKESEKEELDKIEMSRDSLGYERLLTLLRRGTGFHHAGMLSDQRRIVERLFRERKIKLIVATTTLAAGMNLPARSVVIRDIFRYDGFSSAMIPNLEIQQMLGRAGRVRFDKIGNGYIWSSRQRAKEVFSEYINGEVESIKSRMTEPKVRMHVLGLISSGLCKDQPSLSEFFSTTLASYDNLQLEEWIERSIIFLKEKEMIRGELSFKATPFGRKVSELYIDPVSGSILRETARLEETEEILAGICSTPDMPSLYVSESDNIPGYLLSAFPFNIKPEQAKVALILRDWIDEIPEETIVEKYHIWPADLRSRVETADWLSHSLYEISRVIGLDREDLKNLNYRLANGVLEDLIPLTFLPNVGRVRARRLRLNGYDLERIADSNPADLEKIQGFGGRLSENIIKDARRLIEKRLFTHSK